MRSSKVMCCIEGSGFLCAVEVGTEVAQISLQPLGENAGEVRRV